MRTVIGEVCSHLSFCLGFIKWLILILFSDQPTGTSSKFANLMAQAIEGFQVEHNVTLDKITKIPLEGEGTINGRVEK